MHKIGQRIKELRKKNDMTQEKLADYLSVTHKAVSKWECGVTVPDLALIVPLARVLHVTTDELLGMSKEACDERRAELEDNLHKAWEKGGERDGFELVYEAEEALVREYPGDMKLLCDFAWIVSNRALHMEDRENEIRRAIHLFETVIETTDDEKLKVWAIQGIIQSFSYIGCYHEARAYIEMLPDAPSVTKDQLLEFCICGDELRKHRQKRLLTKLHSMIPLMEQCSDDQLHAMQQSEEILKIFFPDRNYLELHCDLAELAFRKSRVYTKLGMYSEAVNALESCKKHSILADKSEVHEEELKYTSPYFDLLELKPFVPTEHVLPSYKETFEIQIQDDCFAPLRDRDDFKALLQ